MLLYWTCPPPYGIGLKHLLGEYTYVNVSALNMQIMPPHSFSLYTKNVSKNHLEVATSIDNLKCTCVIYTIIPNLIGKPRIESL